MQPKRVASLDELGFYLLFVFLVGCPIVAIVGAALDLWSWKTAVVMLMVPIGILTIIESASSSKLPVLSGLAVLAGMALATTTDQDLVGRVVSVFLVSTGVVVEYIEWRKRHAS